MAVGWRPFTLGLGGAKCFGGAKTEHHTKLRYSSIQPLKRHVTIEDSTPFVFNTTSKTAFHGSKIQLQTMKHLSSGVKVKVRDLARVG